MITLSTLLAGLFFIPIDPIKVVVLDSGLNSDHRSLVECPGNLSKDLTNQGLNDIDKHGTLVSGLINAQVNFDVRYCQIIVKYFNHIPHDSIYLKSLQYITSLNNISIVNLSLTGVTYLPEEARLIKSMLDRKIIFTAASGNEAVNLDFVPIYPASLDPRIIVVGNSDMRYNQGYGRVVDIYESGNSKIAWGIKGSGTSMSTAITTGKIINYLWEQRKNREK